MLKLEHFLYVIEVHKAGSISKAAEALFVSQPYLSTLIREIEQEIHVKLFNRHSKGVTLTTEGEAFIAEARVIEQALQNVREISKDAQPRVHRLAIASIYSYSMLDLYYEYSKAFSNDSLVLTYEETQNQLILNKVIQKEVDLGILYLDSDTLSQIRPTLESLHPELTLDIFLSEPVTIAVSHLHPLFSRTSVPFAEVKNYDLLIEPYKLKVPVIAETVKGITLEPSQFENNRSLLYYLSKSDRCFTLGQRSLNTKNPFVASGQLAYIPLTDLPYEIHIGCAYLESPTPNPYVVSYRQRLETYFDSYSKEGLK